MSDHSAWTTEVIHCEKCRNAIRDVMMSWYHAVIADCIVAGHHKGLGIYDDVSSFMCELQIARSNMCDKCDVRVVLLQDIGDVIVVWLSRKRFETVRVEHGLSIEEIVERRRLYDEQWGKRLKGETQ